MRVITIKAADDPSGYCRRAKIQYWSNCTGDLYDPKSVAGSHELNPSDLPMPLRYPEDRLEIPAEDVLTQVIHMSGQDKDNPLVYHMLTDIARVNVDAKNCDSDNGEGDLK